MLDGVAYEEDVFGAPVLERPTGSASVPGPQ
jgi:hypothetical protein